MSCKEQAAFLPLKEIAGAQTVVNAWQMWWNENYDKLKLSPPKTRSSVGTVKILRSWLVCMNECEWDWREVTVCDAIGLAWDENLDNLTPTNSVLVNDKINLCFFPKPLLLMFLNIKCKFSSVRNKDQIHCSAFLEHFAKVICAVFDSIMS